MYLGDVATCRGMIEYDRPRILNIAAYRIQLVHGRYSISRGILYNIALQKYFLHLSSVHLLLPAVIIIKNR